MAGMEQLEIHSKHPGAGASLTPSLAASASFDAAAPNVEAPAPRPSSSRNDSSTAVEKLKGIGLILVLWPGKCEAEKVSTGKYDVPIDQAGMYALVFDNTFSKQFAKTATFALLTYPTNAPPSSSHHLHHFQASPAAAASTSSLGGKASPGLAPPSASTDSIQDHSRPVSSADRPGSRDSHVPPSASFYTGVLQKRRRKRHQGFARRFFSLDFTSSTLSYYHNKDSSALRGAIPLALAAISANEKEREISVDSGAEVWHLRATTQKEFKGWVDALEKASRTAQIGTSSAELTTPKTAKLLPTEVNAIAEGEWTIIERLAGRVAGTRDAVRRLALEYDPYRSPASSSPGIGSGSPIEGPIEPVGIEHPKEKEKRPFWKRKTSSGPGTPVSPQRSVSAQLGVPGTANGAMAIPGRRHLSNQDWDLGGHCTAILRDLDSVVAEFATLIAESKRRRWPVPVPTVSANSRQSMESNSDQEFFDAEGGEVGNDSQLLYLNRDSEDEVAKPGEEYFSDSDSASNSDVEGAESFDKVRSRENGSDSLFPPKPKSLSPLPLEAVRRRRTVPASTVLPPSLIGFLRKNVGKDLSTISMPVSANEPLSILQRVSEIMEYTSLLDASANANSETGERLLHIAAYAISTFSNSRVKERSLRKPFNPMLGETFELVREDKGFRFISEKVSHRPVRMACHAESKNWTLTQSPMPTQKFWGKSVELNTEGRVRVVLHSTGDRFSWTGATCFLRNIIAGEKYVEPVGTMTVINETNGQKAVVTFKAKGMFSGRSEEVDVQAYDETGELLPLGLSGKWTASLSLIETATGVDVKPSLWTVGDLVDNAPARYGFTAFAASLNEVSSMEKGRLPPSDSRLRPDQRAAEQGSLERAEDLKTRLEEAQRRRRRDMEESAETWVPRWFLKVPGAEDEWRYKTGKESYWEERARGSWDVVPRLFDA
ncbi:hypothetical protein GP486_006337 [Trichoglossum hirsutum]|uniref:PH domain-containing protein n=1 Tax=Trichoglossum hirsutum TaxID=265104 RepID=A0A9P8IH23_9PEZI|nr:hypothetical protein GP486_006337 [Trichoglossum hirsutum]